MNKNKGFTLIELLVVIAIIGILAAVAIPMYKSNAMKDRIISSTENLAYSKNISPDKIKLKGKCFACYWNGSKIELSKRISVVPGDEKEIPPEVKLKKEAVEKPDIDTLIATWIGSLQFPDKKSQEEEMERLITK